MKFRKLLVWMLMLAMILNLPASTLADRSPVCTNHVWSEWDPIEQPTCTSPGHQVRFCQVCHTQQTGTIPKLPHSWDAWTVTKEPTCTSTGSRFHTCTVCGTRETETMDKAPHKYGKWVDIVPATCSSKGSHTRVCDICGYQQTLDSDPLPHTWGEWVTTKNANCTERGEEERTCPVCGTTEKRTTKVNGTIHEWGEWVVRMEPDCEKGGYRSHGCTKCNKWESEKTPPLGHEWGEWIILTPAAPNAPGLREHRCTRCGKTEKENYEFIEEPVQEEGITLTVTLAPSTTYFVGTVEWQPVNSTDTETTSFLGLKNAAPSGNAAVSDAAVYNGAGWMPYPGQEASGSTIPALITVTNHTGEAVNISIASDHLSDVISGTGTEPVYLPADTSLMFEYWISADQQEIDAGSLTRTISAALPDGSEPVTETLSIYVKGHTAIPNTVKPGISSTDLPDGSESDTGTLDDYVKGPAAAPGISGPAVSLVCTSVVPEWHEEYNLMYYLAAMKVTNTGTHPLSMEIMIKGSSDTPTQDILNGWYESPKISHLEPGDEIDFLYIIREFDDDWDIGSVQRTLTVTGLAGSDIPAVTDSASFVFPCSDTNALDLVLTGYHRLAGSDQTIIADLLLTNQGEETLKNIRLSITDNNDNSVSPDHFFGISSEISYSLEPHQSIAFGAEIHPSGEELAHMKVIRRISAVDADASVADTVRLQVDLHTDLVEKALLHLEGELTGPASLQLHEMFGADLNAWNGGSVTLEDIYIDCTIQSPSGKVLLMKSYGTSGSSYAPGKRLQISPAFTITEEMVTAALADLPLKNNQPDTLTFLFSSRGIWRDGTSITPVISTPVIFTVNIKNDSMISIREDTSIPAQNPGAGEVLNIPLIIQNVGDDNLFSLRLDVSQSVDGTIVFEDSLIDDPSVILSPGMEYPYIYSYPVTKEDVERGGISLSFLVRSASRIIDSPIQDICTYSKTLAPEPAEKLLLTKTVTNTPPEGQTAFRLNDTINYLVTITNNTGEDLLDIELVDDITGYDHLEFITYIVLAKGASDSIPFSHVVGPLDVDQQQIENTVHANYTLSSSPEILTASSNTVVTPVEETPVPKRTLVLEKSVTNTPPEGQGAFRLNDTIDYLVTITNNTGRDLHNVEVVDDITGYSYKIFIDYVDIAAGATVSIPFQHIVGPTDVDQKQVENTVHAHYTFSSTREGLTASSNTVVTPVEETPVTWGIVSVFKEVSNHPLDPKGYALNEQIDYDITVHNGHAEDVEIDVWDHVWGTEAPELVAQVTLAPGETQSFSHAYIVREVDLPPTPDLIGKVINEACVGVLIYDGRGEVIDGYTAWAEPVEAPTIRTATPEKKDPPETPAVTPKAQTGGGESCRRVLTGHGSVGSEYDLLFCTKHSMLETVTRKLPVSEAIDAWKDAVNSGYDALAEKAGAETAALIHIDQLLFFQQLDAYQSMLTEVFGEEKAGETILQHLRERSNDLCYALHHAPAERPDSILRTGIPVLSAKGERAEACGRTIEPIAGGYHVTQTVCRTHDFITSRLGLRLTDASMEEKTAAFEDAGKLWMSLLMKESNTLYAGLTDEGKSAMSASLSLFQSWLTARRNVLLALYPGNPSVAAELFSNTVRSYVLDLEVLMK